MLEDPDPLESVPDPLPMLEADWSDGLTFFFAGVPVAELEVSPEVPGCWSLEVDPELLVLPLVSLVLPALLPSPLPAVPAFPDEPWAWAFDTKDETSARSRADFTRGCFFKIDPFDLCFSYTAKRAIRIPSRVWAAGVVNRLSILK